MRVIFLKGNIMGYGMFTSHGNEVVHELVTFAKKHMLNEKCVVAMLVALSKNETFSEATDTVVRERVLIATTS
jgi:hypothetical protein